MHNQRSILGNYLQESTIRQIRELNAARDARIDALKTRADAEAYVKSVREKIAKSFPLRTILNQRLFVSSATSCIDQSDAPLFAAIQPTCRLKGLVVKRPAFTQFFSSE